ncbi:NAD(P)/FAD-dependent oxidoreductase [Sulfurimonas sp.]
MKKVLVVGGGYGGLRAVEKLSKAENIAVSLIDKHCYHYLQTEMYEFVSGRRNVCDITYNLESFTNRFENVTFVQDEAVNISVLKKKLFGKVATYSYDVLIIAVGMKDFVPSALKKYAYRVKDLRSAVALREHFMRLLFSKVTTKDKKLNIVIGGAGQSGVELAADFMSYAKECSVDAGNECSLHVTLVEGSNTILPGAPKQIQQHAMKRLQSLGVAIIYNTFITDANEKVLVLGDKKYVYDIFVFAGGIVPTSFMEHVSLAKNSRGILMPDKMLKLEKNIYAIGDCAYICDNKGNQLVPTAQIAEQSAEHVAQAILSGKDSIFQGQVYGMFTALGKHYASGHIKNKIFLHGKTAYFLKKAITKLYAYGIKTKLNSSYFKRK